VAGKGSGASGADDVPRLGKVLLLSTNSERRAGAARALGARGSFTAYAYLRLALWDPDESVRASAVDAIGELSVMQSAGELAAVFAWSGPRLRRAIVRTVRRFGMGSSFDGILRLASLDPDRRVRALASRPVRDEPVRGGRS
jgi:HEAT repeat protein